MKKIPPRIYSLKKIYKNFGTNWIPTRDFEDLGISKPHIYQLRGELKYVKWNNKLINSDGSKVFAKGPMKNGNFWKITPKGFLSLYKYFDIFDENLKDVAHKLLLGEEL